MNESSRAFRRCRRAPRRGALAAAAEQALERKRSVVRVGGRHVEREWSLLIPASFYCFVRLIVPERTPEQLNDAYVPVIRLPLTAALIVYGQSVGMDGESIPTSDIPLAVPLKDPAELNVESG